MPQSAELVEEIVPTEGKGSKLKTQSCGDLQVTAVVNRTGAVPLESLMCEVLDQTDWDKADAEVSERSQRKYWTTRTSTINAIAADGTRYQVSINANRFEPKGIREAIGKQAKADLHRLTNTDVAFLQQLEERASKEGNAEGMKQFMTLRLQNQFQGGVDLAGLVTIKTEMEKAVRAAEEKAAVEKAS